MLWRLLRMPQRPEQLSAEARACSAAEQQAWLWSTAPASMQPKWDAQGAAASPAARPLRPGDSARVTKLKADLLRASYTLPADALSSQVDPLCLSADFYAGLCSSCTNQPFHPSCQSLCRAKLHIMTNVPSVNVLKYLARAHASVKRNHDTLGHNQVDHMHGSLRHSLHVVSPSLVKRVVIAAGCMLASSGLLVLR